MIANELMLGDWVFTRGRIEQVTSIYDGYICTEHYEDSHDYYFEPIPLTPEILEKNGFVYNELPFVQAWEQFGLTLTIGGDGFRINCGHNISMIIDHVHELQHALRLCGIFLDIKL